MSATTSPAPAPVTGNSFVQRALDVTLQLGKGSFGTSGFNTVKLSGLRATATIKKLGPPGMSMASVRVYGMTEDLMNAVSTLGVPYAMDRLNNISVDAGDVGGAMSKVYQGQLLNAWQELDGAPDTYMTFDGGSSAFIAMQAVKPISFPGPADAATVMSGIAISAGRSFHNNGVQVHLPPSYFPGTALDQAYACAAAADIEFYDDGDTFWIWPKSGTRFVGSVNQLGQTTGATPPSGTVPLISPATGLIGYPKYMSNGMKFRCLYNPSIQFAGLITMQSSLKPANGQWYVNGLTLDLSAQIHNGPWFCEVDCNRLPGVPTGGS